MDFICDICNRSLIENPCEKYTSNNFKLDEIDEILQNYITIHNKKFDSDFISCELVIEFNNNFIKNLNISNVHKKEINKINQCLLYSIDFFESKGYKICQHQSNDY